MLRLSEPRCPRCTFLALVLFLLAFGTGCDTSNPSTSLADLDGTYSITELRFDPNTSGLPDADVVARLDSAESFVEIFGDGDSEIRYQFIGESRQRIQMTASASVSTVQLSALTETDALQLTDLLLPSQLVLQRDGVSDQRLNASIPTAGVNLEAFDPTLYQEQRSVNGTLHIVFDRR